MKKLTSLLLVIIMTAAVFTGAASAGRAGDADGDKEINNKDVVTLFRYLSGDENNAVKENCDFNNDGKVNNKDVTLLFRAISSGTISETGEEEMEKPYEEGWDQSITKANALANGVQCRYTDDERKGFVFENANMSLKYDLTTYGNKQPAAIYNADGKPYFENTGDAYIVDSDGTLFSAAYSLTNARMNSNRIGYYYYDFHFRDQGFIKPDSDPTGDTYDIIKNGLSWGGNDVKNVSKRNGTVSFQVTSSLDPYILPSKISFSADKYNAILLTIRTEYSTFGNFYLIAGSQTQYNNDQRVDFTCLAGRDTTIYVPLSGISDYTGTVKGFRIDCGIQSGENIVIKELKAISRGKDSVPFSFERTYYTYSDKMHEMLRVIATDNYTNGGRFETKTVIPADTVRKLEIKNAMGEASTLDGFDFSTTEYVAFDIRGAGVYGVIMPNANSNGYINVELKDGNYVITRGIELDSNIVKGSEIVFGHRIYTSTSRQFDGIRKEAYIEGNPLKASVTSYVDNARYSYYDPLSGSYIFTVKALEFSAAYYDSPDKQMRVNARLEGDGKYDRTVYIQTAENSSTRRGRLECAAMLDGDGALLPIPLEVCKNFDGENEEPLYLPEAGTGAAAFGETYVPVTVAKNETKRFTVLHLYQNWGNYPLKQLSSIAFHTPYYHLSVGVTETNCIVPFFVMGKDAWVLPDFRANSAPLWQIPGERGTQHTSVGRLHFLQYKDSDGISYKSESQSADIASAGPVYADITMDYLSDDGKIKATYRHVEMAQTDENRTYYNIKLEVLDDVKIKDFKNDFSFFSFDGSFVAFSKLGYLNKNNVSVTETVSAKTERIITLGKDYPYFDYYKGSVEDSVNFALIVRKSDITIGGQKYSGNFVLKDKYDGNLNFASLSLDLGEVTLKKGDILELQIILMPWGYSTSTDDSNVLNVRKDSCIAPYKITVLEGEPYTDDTVPSVKAINNTAKFKISGGASTAAVRVYGFTSRTAPAVTFKADGNNTNIKLSGPNGNDGYQVYLDEDGTYSFSFNVDMDAANVYEITVTQ
ncbi:MAG: dockerin type I repeat-containing protein [Clostridia bacterium]|nr:dockerin type I repeat-containing protein [Clostridia bacterium]